MITRCIPIITKEALAEQRRRQVWWNKTFPKGPGISYGRRYSYLNGKTYWSDGRISNGAPFDPIDHKPVRGDDPAKWTNQKRKSVIAKLEKERKEAKERRADEQRKRNSLLESAKAKLTPEEYEALESELSYY